MSDATDDVAAFDTDGKTWLAFEYVQFDKSATVRRLRISDLKAILESSDQRAAVGVRLTTEPCFCNIELAQQTIRTRGETIARLTAELAAAQVECRELRDALEDIAHEIRTPRHVEWAPRVRRIIADALSAHSVGKKGSEDVKASTTATEAGAAQRPSFMGAREDSATRGSESDPSPAAVDLRQGHGGKESWRWGQKLGGMTPADSAEAKCAAHGNWVSTCRACKAPVSGAGGKPIRCDYGDACPGHASPDERPCGYDPSNYAHPKPPESREDIAALRESALEGLDSVGRFRNRIHDAMKQRQDTVSMSLFDAERLLISHEYIEHIQARLAELYAELEQLGASYDRMKQAMNHHAARAEKAEAENERLGEILLDISTAVRKVRM